MKNVMAMNFGSCEWIKADSNNCHNLLKILGFKTVGDLLSIRVFDLLNLSKVDNNKAEELLLCLYRLLYSNEKLDEGIYYGEIDQCVSYRRWKQTHRKLEQVTVADIVFTENINKMALLRIFDGVTSAFYKSEEYDSHKYRYGRLDEIPQQQYCGKEGDNG